MTVKFATAAAIAALMAAPALAQSDKSGQQQQDAAAAQQSGQGTQYDGAEGRNPDIKTMNRDAEDYMTGQAGQSGQGSGGMTEQDRQIMAASQEEVRQTLAESGFENVRIRRAAYLVTAMTPDGEPVMMMVDTDRMAGGQQGGRQMNRSGDGQQGGGMNQRNQQSQ